MNYFAINKLAAILKLLLLSVPAKMFILFRSFNVYLFRFFFSPTYNLISLNR